MFQRDAEDSGGQSGLLSTKKMVWVGLPGIEASSCRPAALFSGYETIIFTGFTACIILWRAWERELGLRRRWNRSRGPIAGIAGWTSPRLPLERVGWLRQSSYHRNISLEHLAMDRSSGEGQPRFAVAHRSLSPCRWNRKRLLTTVSHNGGRQECVYLSGIKQWGISLTGLDLQTSGCQRERRESRRRSLTPLPARTGTTSRPRPFSRSAMLARRW